MSDSRVTLSGGVLPLFRSAVGVFYSPSQQSKKCKISVYIYIYIYIYMDDYRYILPYPRRVEFSSEEVIVLPLAPLQVSSYLN